MHDRTARVFSGLGVLVVVWIFVYWAWPVKDDGSSLGPLTIPESLSGGETPPVVEDAPLPRFGKPLGAPAVEPETDSPPLSLEYDAGRVLDDVGVIPPEFDAYTVRSGDNFERISQRVYGTRRHGMAIAKANPLLDPRKLREGMTIRVPIDPTNIQGKPALGNDSPDDDARPAVENPTIEYTVKRGDTLTGIAKSFYGSIRHVDFLYNANRARMSSKDDLRLGQVLLIPPLPEEAD